MKKLKKLKLNKEVVANLNKEDMADIKGGTAWFTKTNPCYQSSSGVHTKPPRCCEYGCCETVTC